MNSKHVANLNIHNDYDNKFYESELGDTFNSISIASNILENCKSIEDFSDLNDCILKIASGNVSYLSTLFLNVDGNQSNFDNFLALTKLISDSKFSVIGLAETNTDYDSLYNIPNYHSFYQHTYPNKQKGTGIALYLHNSFNAVKCNGLSHTSENLETLFISISCESTPCTVGVVYRPPNGDMHKFIEEFNLIISNCPKNTYIMGDFNIDLHNLDNDNSNAYEEIILTNDFYPLISIPTHCKPGCRDTCIDNVITNCRESVLESGTVDESVSHHKLIFQIYPK